MRNHLKTSETENEICTFLKSELISFNSGRVFATIHGKYVHHNHETAKIGFCTSLKSISIFCFVDTGDKINAD